MMSQATIKVRIYQTRLNHVLYLSAQHMSPRPPVSPRPLQTRIWKTRLIAFLHTRSLWRNNHAFHLKLGLSQQRRYSCYACHPSAGKTPWADMHGPFIIRFYLDSQYQLQMVRAKKYQPRYGNRHASMSHILRL